MAVIATITGIEGIMTYYNGYSWVDRLKRKHDYGVVLRASDGKVYQCVLYVGKRYEWNARSLAEAEASVEYLLDVCKKVGHFAFPERFEGFLQIFKAKWKRSEEDFA